MLMRSPTQTAASQESTRSQIGIAEARDNSDPLRENLVALAKRVVKR